MSAAGETVELLLVTSSWPNATVPEFLDEEIKYLAEQFDRIVVAPMRPRERETADLPDKVVVDYSLADFLIRNRLSRRRQSRPLTAALRAAQPNQAGLGFSRSEFRGDCRHAQWFRHAVLARADSRSVASWAASRPRPTLAYTFWLGAATVGLRHAYPGVPLVSRVHGGDLFSEAHLWASIPFQHAALQAVDLGASVSEAGRDYLARKFPDTAEKTVWRRLGIRDLGGLADPPESAAVRLLSASSIDGNKRVPAIAEVARALAISGHSVEWTHLGDGPERSALTEALARGPETLVVDLRGQVPLDAVHRELKSGGHTAFINLSLSEGAPVSLMEAQCVGLPVVATAVGGTPEVVPGRLNELVTADDSVAEICAAVLRAAARPHEERPERRSLWAQNYSAEVNYSSWAAELGKLVSG